VTLTATLVNMKMAELSRVTDVPVTTLKYYLREGLLPQGRVTAVNQADYDHDHVRRVRLVRALLDLGGLGVDDVRR
jgi:DNA-binding transcriptional MerR regulator